MKQFWITAWYYIMDRCCIVLLDEMKRSFLNSLVWSKPFSVLPFKLIDVKLGHAIHTDKMKTFLPHSDF